MLYQLIKKSNQTGAVQGLNNAPADGGGKNLKLTPADGTVKGDDISKQLIRAKESIVQGIGWPGAMMGVYALGNNPRHGSVIPGVVGALGGSWAGGALYDWASNNETFKPYIDKAKTWVDKNLWEGSSEYLPGAARLLGAVAGYGLLKNSSDQTLYGFNKLGNIVLGIKTIANHAGKVVGSLPKLAKGVLYGGGAMLVGTNYDNIDSAIKNVAEAAARANKGVDTFNKSLDIVNKQVLTAAPAIGDNFVKATDNFRLATLNVENATKHLDVEKTIEDVKDHVSNDAKAQVTSELAPLKYAAIGLAAGVPLFLYLNNRKSKKRKR